MDEKFKKMIQEDIDCCKKYYDILGEMDCYIGELDELGELIGYEDLFDCIAKLQELFRDRLRILRA